MKEKPHSNLSQRTSTRKVSFIMHTTKFQTIYFVLTKTIEVKANRTKHRGREGKKALFQIK